MISKTNCSLGLNADEKKELQQKYKSTKIFISFYHLNMIVLKQILDAGLIFEKLKKVCKPNTSPLYELFHCWLLRLRIDCSVSTAWASRPKFLTSSLPVP